MYASFVNNSDLRVGKQDNHLVLFWKATPTQQSIAQLGKIFDTTAAPLYVLSVIDALFSLPDAENRELMQSLVAKTQSRVAAVGIVIRGGGFTASAVRAFISGMVLLTKPPYPVKAFAAIDDATTWMSTVHKQVKKTSIDPAINLVTRDVELFCKPAT